MDILITEEVDSSVIQWLIGKYRVVCEPMLWKDTTRLKSAIAEARTIMVRNQTQITKEMLATAPKLIGIGRVGVGLDNIDVENASQRGVVIIAPLGANATSVAEFTIGLMLSLVRKIPAAHHSTQQGNWDRKSFVGVELEGKTLAVVGFGRIGRRVGNTARALGMRVLIFDPFTNPDSPEFQETGAVFCPRLEEALAEADVVSVHSPLTEQTRHLFNRQVIGSMKRGAVLINTSRGGVIDEAALLEALGSGHLAGAALDVREVEPASPRNGFESMPNVILTPHMASFTQEAQKRTLQAVAEDLDRLLGGTAALHFVNFARPQYA
jgi:D-3-phosphoglycerate dehydrogenase